MNKVKETSTLYVTRKQGIYQCFAVNKIGRTSVSGELKIANLYPCTSQLKAETLSESSIRLEILKNATECNSTEINETSIDGYFIFYDRTGE